MQRSTIEVSAVGVVQNNQHEAVDEGWDDVVSTIVLHPELSKGLTGLDSFSHVWVVVHLHDALFVEEKHLSRHPRDDRQNPEVGIFAQRARHRPNRLGITACPIISVDPAAGELKVSGLDAIDGTPVVDIKPYVAAFDLRHDTKIPLWMQKIMRGYFES